MRQNLTSGVVQVRHALWICLTQPDTAISVAGSGLFADSGGVTCLGGVCALIALIVTRDASSIITVSIILFPPYSLAAARSPSAPQHCYVTNAFVSDRIPLALSDA